MRERPPEHGVVSPLAASVGGDLLVGEHGAEPRAPVDRRLAQPGQPVGVDHPAPVDGVEVGPLGVPLRRGATARLELLDQLVDGARPVGVGVVPGVEDLQEDPLGPPVVVVVGGGDGAAGVVAQSEGPQLAPHVRDVGLGGGAGMGAGLACVLLSRQAEGVVAQGVQHVVAGHPAEPGEHVGGDVAERMSDVEPRARGVGEHVHHEELGAVRDEGPPGREVADRVGCVEGALGLPVALPLLLDLVGERGVVTVDRWLGGGRLGHRGHRLPGGPRGVRDAQRAPAVARARSGQKVPRSRRAIPRSPTAITPSAPSCRTTPTGLWPGNSSNTSAPKSTATATSTTLTTGIEKRSARSGRRAGSARCR